MERDKKPDWKYWNACETLRVWEAVALSIDRDPRNLFTSRDLTDAKSDAYSRRLAKAAGIAGREMRFIILGEDFHNRMELVKRAIAVRPADLLAFPKDPYIGFKEAHELEVRPNAVRRFFSDRQYSVPEGWTAPVAVNSTNGGNESPEAWIKYAQQICLEIRKAKPKRNLDRIADDIHARFVKEDRRTDRGDIPEAGYIRRWALQNLPKP